MHTTNEAHAPLGRQPLLDKLDEVERALSAQLDSLGAQYVSAGAGQTERIGKHWWWAIGWATCGACIAVAVLKGFGQL